MKELCKNCGKFIIISKETLNIIREEAKKEERERTIEEIQDIIEHLDRKPLSTEKE